MKRLLLIFLVASVPSVQAATVETFVSPDSSFPALSGFIGKANSSLFIASYTFSSPEITQMLIDKKSNGVEIGLIVEKSPAGGMSEYQVAALCALYVKNITVVLYDGPLRYMHAKYIIMDGRSAFITSENLGYSGFMPGGEYGNRGWGAIVDGETVGELLEIYNEDIADSVPFTCQPGKYVLNKWDPAGAYSPSFERNIYTDQKVDLIYSPDSLDELLSLINSARKSIDVEEFYIYTHWGSPTYDSVESSPNPLLEALIDKARDGIEVRILLDSSYYNMDEEKSVSNYNTIIHVNNISENEKLPLEAAAMDLDFHGLSTLHNKGIIVDGNKVLVSSINWNENSVMNNRETGIIIEGDAAGYYKGIFEHDWKSALKIYPNGSRSRVTSGTAIGMDDYGIGFAPAMVSLAALALVVLYFSRRKINFKVDL